MGFYSPYPTRTKHRDLEGPFFIYFETNSVSAPDGVQDDAGVLTTTGTKVARAAQGQFTVTMDDTFTEIYATAWCEEADTYVAQVSGRSTTTITISVLDNMNAEVDSTDQTIGAEIWVRR